jgi:hypothetical protein
MKMIYFPNPIRFNMTVLEVTDAKTQKRGTTPRCRA